MAALRPGIRQRTREIVNPSDVGVMVPLRGRYLRPRSVIVDQTPEKLLDVNPDRLGAWVFNNGGQIEIPIPLPGSSTGLALAQFLDSAGIEVPSYLPSTYKSMILVVDTALAWVTGAQPTLQLIVGRTSWPVQSGAASGAGGNAQNVLRGAAAANLGPVNAAATSLATGIYVFSPADIADLQWHHRFVGAELKFGSALTAGAARFFLEAPGGPVLFLGEDNLIDVDRSGNPAGAFAIPAQSAPQWVQSDGEIWAAASRGGVIDVRVWEVLVETPPPAEPPYRGY